MTFQCGWYWGPLGWENAEAKLEDKPDGSFLVRDSSDDRYILSLSFRSQNVTHHTRIEHYKGKPDCHKTWTLFFVWMLVSTLMHCAVCSIQMAFLLPGMHFYDWVSLSAVLKYQWQCSIVFCFLLCLIVCLHFERLSANITILVFSAINVLICLAYVIWHCMSFILRD